MHRRDVHLPVLCCADNDNLHYVSSSSPYTGGQCLGPASTGAPWSLASTCNGPTATMYWSHCHPTATLLPSSRVTRVFATFADTLPPCVLACEGDARVYVNISSKSNYIFKSPSKGGACVRAVFFEVAELLSSTTPN